MDVRNDERKNKRNDNKKKRRKIPRAKSSHKLRHFRGGKYMSVQEESVRRPVAEMEGV